MKRNWLSRFTGRKQVQAEKICTFEGVDVERSRVSLRKRKNCAVFRVELGGGVEGRKVSRDRAAELCKDRSFTALWATEACRSLFEKCWNALLCPVEISL